MVKNITTIFINSSNALYNGNASNDSTRLYSVSFDTPPIVIKNKANLKVANFCHTDTAANNLYGSNIFTFKIDGIMTDNSKFIANDGGIPTILATNLNNTRNLYEENDIPLVRQTINSIKLSISDDLINPNAGILKTVNFCISLKLEEELNEY